MSKEGDNGHGVEAIRVPMITVTFDPSTYKIEIGGNTPGYEFAKGLLQMAADELERKIAEARMQKRIELATADALPFLRGPQG